MAEYLTGRVKWIVAAAALGVAATALATDTLDDPTRPPADVLAAASGVQAPVDPGPVLQSVKISRTQKVAVISGQQVAVGGKLGEAKLVAVRDHEADLRHPDGSLQTLQMYTGVNKTVIEVKRKVPANVSGIKRP